MINFVSIGMGMNTALRDAQKFNELLDKFHDDLEQALTQYSKDRVPEGNALTDLALHMYCFDIKVQMKTIISSAVRTALHRLFPSLVSNSAGNLLGRPQHTLSEVYQLATEQGIIPKHRAINDKIRQEFFERETGMIVAKPQSSNFLKYVIIVGIVACGVTFFAQ